MEPIVCGQIVVSYFWAEHNMNITTSPGMEDSPVSTIFCPPQLIIFIMRVSNRCKVGNWNDRNVIIIIVNIWNIIFVYYGAKANNGLYLFIMNHLQQKMHTFHYEIEMDIPKFMNGNLIWSYKFRLTFNPWKSPESHMFMSGGNGQSVSSEAMFWVILCNNMVAKFSSSTKSNKSPFTRPMYPELPAFLTAEYVFSNNCNCIFSIATDVTQSVVMGSKDHLG